MNYKVFVENLVMMTLIPFLFFSSGCSSSKTSAGETGNKISAQAKENNCEAFASEWNLTHFKNIYDEEKIICGDDPCYKGVSGGGGLRLSCSDGKITGEAILSRSTGITPKQETTTSIKEATIENNVLNLSYFDSRGCLHEISVSVKREFLFGTFKTTGCKVRHISENEEDFLNGKKGGVLATKKFRKSKPKSTP